MFFVDVIQFRREDDSHDDSVNSDDFAEDNGDQVFSSYTWRLDTSTKDRRAGDEDAPAE